MMILAGGEATRLGPLAAQMNKALVSIKQRPVLAHHVQRAKDANVDQLTIVCDETSRRQLERTLQLMGCPIPWRIVIQPVALGPVDAMMRGMSGLDHGSSSNDDTVIITAADTFIDPTHTFEPIGGVERRDRWLGAMKTDDISRSWCYWDGEHWTDGQPTDGPNHVFIGVFAATTQRLRRAIGSVIHKHGNRVLLAPLLNHLDDDGTGMWMEQMTGWHDTGDVAALAVARRATFTSRASHRVLLDDRGVITKTGVSDDEYFAAEAMSKLLLGPRVLGYARNTLRVEYIDTPSLAELWLYWPARPETWTHIISTIIGRLQRDLWPTTTTNVCTAQSQAAMYIDKTEDRLHRNGSDRMPRPLADYLESDVIRPRDAAHVHGDLNFGNILYGLGSDVFRLIDARGSFGGNSPTVGDDRYDIAKLRFSWNGLTAITHGLEVQRGEIIEALDDLLEGMGYNLKHLAAIEATMFLSSMPLHVKSEQEPMYYAAMSRMKEALS